MAIQLTGLGGFDSGSVISQLVDLARQPLRDIDTKKTQVDVATSTLSSFSAKLTALKNAATALATLSGFTSMAASSTDSGVVATVTGSAVASSFSVEVTQLARAQKTRSDAQSSATAPLGQAGDLEIATDGGTVTVSILPTDSLADIASKIGQSGARVSAAVVNAGGSYRLNVQGLDTGAAKAFTFTETGGLSLGLSTPANTYETAEDAALTIDGLAVSRPTNSIADAIPGVTLALTKTTTEAATVRVAGDSSALKAKLSSFVSLYNDIVNTGHNVAGYGTTKAQNPVLAADSGIRRALDQISSIVTGAVPNATGDYRSLSAVGISLSRDGLMSFDASKLDAALERDPESVRRLFVTDAQSGATGVMKTLSDAITNLVTGDSGAVKSRIDALSAQSRRLVESRSKKEERVLAYEQQLRRQFASLDQAMSRYQAMSNALGSITSLTNKSG
ncbi:MAG: flagellar filament capping protein FliD [Labilithrix sp.]|nr:flagellar filament capping protein FliD [Labilithrix sp.]MCW5835078.1 flagellar filament capping protein FliD [Labilithrix sp.]